METEHADLAARYPRTIAAFAAMGALDQLAQIAHLDAVWAAIRAGVDQSAQVPFDLLPPSAFSSTSTDYDLIYAGGGLNLLHAVVMARKGYKILLFDRGEVGCAHREWNISYAELQALVDIGFCSWDELQTIIMAEYTAGVVRFFADAGEPSTALYMRDVLNVALDAGALLRLARRKLESFGGVVLDQRRFCGLNVQSNGALCVRVMVARPDGKQEHYQARLLIDGMGSVSPLTLRRFRGHAFAGVCPTVGTVAQGFVPGTASDEYNPQLGDILISVAHAQRGQQYMWEGFPGRGDNLTVYLFYYENLVHFTTSYLKNTSSQIYRNKQQTSISLLQLFEDYFTLLPNYKRLGPDFRHVKPVYGYIPARHGLRQPPVPLLRGVLPLGDAAAQQSPLTFCGFGSHVRNLARTTDLLDIALRSQLLNPDHLSVINANQVNVSLNWVFSRFMQPWAAPDDVNRLQNLFLAVLNHLGEDLTRRFFRDQMRWGDYHRIVLGMFWRHPRIVLTAWRVLGIRGIARWLGDYLAYSWIAMLACCGRRLGANRRWALVALATWFSPALGLSMRACFAEWRAMGWLT